MLQLLLILTQCLQHALQNVLKSPDQAQCARQDTSHNNIQESSGPKTELPTFHVLYEHEHVLDTPTLLYVFCVNAVFFVGHWFPRGKALHFRVGQRGSCCCSEWTTQVQNGSARLMLDATTHKKLVKLSEG